MIINTDKMEPPPQPAEPLQQQQSLEQQINKSINEAQEQVPTGLFCFVFVCCFFWQLKIDESEANVIVDYTKIPVDMERKFDELDLDGTLRPTTINIGE
jgi:hypothetical protein